MKRFEKYIRIIVPVVIVLLAVAVLLFCGEEKSVETVSPEPSEQDTVKPKDDGARNVFSTEVIEEIEVNTEKEISEKTEEASDEKILNESVSLENAPENESAVNDKLFCSLAVVCDEINKNIELLSEEKRRLIPENGIIYKKENVEFSDGETAFDVLKREMKNNKIHFEYVNTPIYDSVYIEGINNIYEFDCGAHSGWLYSVNGEFPNCGCSQFKLKDGDKIKFIYTCDMGKNVERTQN